MKTDAPFGSFAEFWPYYLGEHSRTWTRWLHFAGTALLLPVLVLAVLASAWWLLLLPVVGYGFAWLGHFAVEHNRPATFRHPLWSLRGDFLMFWLMLTGRLERERARLDK
ncbi:MAG: DUF962 domain-containing protein [Gammaproteobacteria bacterium]|jgi:hypothetical protein